MLNLRSIPSPKRKNIQFINKFEPFPTTIAYCLVCWKPNQIDEFSCEKLFSTTLHWFHFMSLHSLSLHTLGFRALTRKQSNGSHSTSTPFHAEHHALFFCVLFPCKSLRFLSIFFFISIESHYFVGSNETNENMKK